MSNERIVNRTPETFGQKLERERLEAETQMSNEGSPEAENLLTVGGVVVGRQIAAQEIGIARVGGDGIIDEPVPSAAPRSENAAHSVASVWNPAAGIPALEVMELRSSVPQNAEPPDTMYSPSAELISQLLKERAAATAERSHAPRDPDLLLFKKQVIDAFRHMGLDTAKFFV